MNEDQVSKLAKKANNYQNCVVKGAEQVNEHMSDIERNFHRKSENSSEPIDPAELELILEQDYKQRLKLWLDLCRISRKQQIWDICRVSCRFGVLYDTKTLIDRFLKKRSLYDIELMRNLAEIHFILGEVIMKWLSLLMRRGKII